MFRGLDNIRPTRWGYYEGTEQSTGVAWYVRRSRTRDCWEATRDGDRGPSLFGNSLAEVSDRLRKE